LVVNAATGAGMAAVLAMIEEHTSPLFEEKKGGLVDNCPSSGEGRLYIDK
jgi:hypothetical protein